MIKITHKFLFISLSIVIASLSSGCSSTFLAPHFSSSYSAGYGAQIRVNKMPAWGNGFLEYKSYSHLLKELEEEADIKMWEPGVFEKKKELLPSGGHIYFKYCRSSPKWSHSVVIKQNGKVIKRYSTHEVLFHSYNEYLRCFDGSFLFSLDKELTYPVEVFVIDEYAKERYEYTIIPDET
jgi:hypothetical protein